MLRPLAIAAAALALLAAFAAFVSGAEARTAKVAITRAPATALQGKLVKVTVATTPARFTRCALTVTYSDGTSELIGRLYTRQGKVEFAWRVPEVAQPGRARLNTTCPGSGRSSRAITVVGTLIPPTVDVVDQGFSVRPKALGSLASYGLLLKNSSPNVDALDVYVLVNFLMADGQAIGTKSETISAIAAGTTYAYGGSLNFPGAAPVARLEVVVKIGGKQRRAVKQPLVQSIGLAPGIRDAAWLGEVNGEIVNDQPALNVSRAKLSAVVFDATGRIVGGGAGTAGALLPPGTRQVFKVTTGVDAVPWPQAARALVSLQATYTP